MEAGERQVFEFESFLLDARGRVLLRHGEVVRLTPKALDALLLLVRNSGLVVAKERLLEEVWAQAFVEEGSVARAIHELRHVLGDNSSHPRFIETIPKRGYRFVAPVQSRSADREETVIERHLSARVTTREEEEVSDADHVREVLALPASTSHPKGRLWRITGAVVSLALISGAAAWFAFVRSGSPSQLDRPRPRGGVVRLTYNAAADQQPSWSPDASKIAFVSNRDGKNQIYVMDADGSNVKRLTNNQAEDSNPSWSPDGSKIAFNSDRDGNPEI